MHKNFDVLIRTEVVGEGCEATDRNVHRTFVEATDRNVHRTFVGATDRSVHRTRQRGLAALEMVMVLPLLMMFMALIMVFGYAACWKVRTETVARDSVWQARWHRYAGIGERSQEWPAPNTFGQHGGGSLSALSNVPVLSHPVIAGPIPQINVNQQLLDFERGVLVGVARVDQSPPVFSDSYSYNFEVSHWLLDNRFQVHQMGISNRTRRLPLIYGIGLDDIRQQLQSLVAAIEGATFWAQLAALDRDQEFYSWYGSTPDFHPRVRSFCNTDSSWVESERLPNLVRRIENLPQRMARATIGLYNDMLDADPPLPQATQDQLQSDIDALDEWVQKLNEP